LPRNALSKVDRTMLQAMVASTDEARFPQTIAPSRPKRLDERLGQRVARIR
jgi:hypothetical protein